MIRTKSLGRNCAILLNMAREGTGEQALQAMLSISREKAETLIDFLWLLNSMGPDTLRKWIEKGETKRLLALMQLEEKKFV